MHEEFVSAIARSVNDIAIAFLNNEVQAGPALPKPDATPYEPPQGEIAARITFTGGIQGGVHLTSSLEVAANLASTFTGDPMATDDPMVKDAFGELANQVAGGIQTILSAHYGNINLSPPVVSVKSKLAGDYSSSFGSTKHFFKFKGGAFLVDMYYQG